MEVEPGERGDVTGPANQIVGGGDRQDDASGNGSERIDILAKRASPPGHVTAIELDVAKLVLPTIAESPEAKATAGDTTRRSAARTLALPDALSVEDLTALLTSAGGGR